MTQKTIILFGIALTTLPQQAVHAAEKRSSKFLQVPVVLRTADPLSPKTPILLPIYRTESLEQSLKTHAIPSDCFENAQRVSKNKIQSSIPSGSFAGGYIIGTRTRINQQEDTPSCYIVDKDGNNRIEISSDCFHTMDKYIRNREAHQQQK